jgi:hypothetical protein
MIGEEGPADGLAAGHVASDAARSRRNRACGLRTGSVAFEADGFVGETIPRGAVVRVVTGDAFQAAIAAEIAPRLHQPDGLEPGQEVVIRADRPGWRHLGKAVTFSTHVQLGFRRPALGAERHGESGATAPRRLDM